MKKPTNGSSLIRPKDLKIEEIRAVRQELYRFEASVP
jgi:hypothetical protein